MFEGQLEVSAPVRTKRPNGTRSRITSTSASRIDSRKSQCTREKYPEAKPRIISDNGPQFIARFQGVHSHLGHRLQNPAATRILPSRRGGNMAPLDFGPYLCSLNSPSFMSLQLWIRPPIVLFASDHRTAGKSKRSQVVERFGVPLGRFLNQITAVPACIYGACD
jgi:hypothetical protein